MGIVIGILSVLVKIFLTLVAIGFVFFIVTFIYYWFNIDMKRMWKKYPKLMDYYDKLPRDKRLL